MRGYGCVAVGEVVCQDEDAGCADVSYADWGWATSVVPENVNAAAITERRIAEV